MIVIEIINEKNWDDIEYHIYQENENGHPIKIDIESTLNTKKKNDIVMIININSSFNFNFKKSQLKEGDISSTIRSLFPTLNMDDHMVQVFFNHFSNSYQGTIIKKKDFEKIISFFEKMSLQPSTVFLSPVFLSQTNQYDDSLPFDIYNYQLSNTVDSQLLFSKSEKIENRQLTINESELGSTRIPAYHLMNHLPKRSSYFSSFSPEFKSTETKAQKIKLIERFILPLLILVLSFQLIHSFQMRKLKDLESKYIELKPIIDAKKILESENFSGYNHQKTDYAMLIDEVSRLKPDNIIISSFELENTKANIKCTTSNGSNFSITEWINAINNLTWTKNATLSIFETNEKEKQFIIELDF